MTVLQEQLQLAVTSGVDNEGIVQITGSGITFTGAIGTSGLASVDVDETTTVAALLDARIIDVATGKTLTADDNFAGDATTVNGTGKIIFKTDAGGAATTAVAAVINADADGSGTLQFTNTSLTTVTGNVGVTKQIGTIDADKSVTFVVLLMLLLLILLQVQLKIDDDFTGTVTTLTTTGTLAFAVDADGAAVTNVTGTIDGLAVEGGDILVNNSGGTVFAGKIGSIKSIGDVNVDELATFNDSVAGETMDVKAGKVANFKSSVTVTDDSVLNGQAVFAGTNSYSVNAFLQEGAGAGNISVTNTSTDGLTFVQAIGTNDANAADAIDIFAAATATKTILQSDDNQADEVNLVGTATIVIDRTILAGETVFMDSAETVAGDIPATAKIFMPSNLKDGEGIYILSDVTTVSTIAANVTTAAQDNALYTYTATVVREVDTDGADDVKITANARTSGAIATQLSTTTNEAIGLYEASRAAADAASDTAAVDALSNALNSQNGLTTADATSLAKQVAPQTDTIGGSAVATRAMTGTVQGIVSNRMASLRSGDAFVTGMSAGNGMSANSGFIQAFGSEGEQKNTTSSGAKVYGYDTETSGVAIGFDGMTDTGETIGLSASYLYN